MNSKYLSLPKTKKYIQKKYLQFKEIRNPKRQTIYFVYYTVQWAALVSESSPTFVYT